MKKILWEKRIELFRRIALNGNKKRPISYFITGLYTYAQGSRVVKIFEDGGLVSTELVGREKHVKLTKKGIQVLNQLNKLEGIEI